MRKTVLIAILLLARGAAQVTPAPGMPWSGILDPSRGVNWSHAGVWNSPPLTGHGIPHRTTPCTVTGYNATNNVIAPSGLTNATDQNNINGAIQQCALQSSASNPLVLQLGAGTFYVVGGITFNGTNYANFLTLRGQGPDKTKLLVTTTGSQPQCNAICMVASANEGPATIYSPGYAGACEWTAGYAPGTTILTLGNCITGVPNPTQNEFTNQANGMPVPGMHIDMDQRNDDVSLFLCRSSGTTATCIAAAPLPTPFQVGACVGVGGTGNNGNTNVAYGTAGSGGSLIASGYNVSLLTPVRYTGPGSQNCTAAITAIGSDTTTAPCSSANPCPTFSYTMPGGSSNAPTWFCGGAANAPAAPPQGLGPNTYNTSSTYAPCMATVDTGGITLTAVICVTASGNCTAQSYGSSASVAPSGGMADGRICPDPWFNGSSGARPWMVTCQGASTGQPNEISLRSQTKVVTVVACSTCAANQIAIDVPLQQINWRASQRPGIYWYHYFLHDVGVEDLTVDGFEDGGTTSNGIIAIWHCYNCWARNLRTLSGSRNHYWIYESSQHVEIRDSYLWGNKRGSTQSYGVELFDATSDALVENNIFEHVVSSMMNSGAWGTVQSYNYQVDAGYGTVNFNIAMETTSHALDGSNLFEGNNTNGTNIDNIHGTTASPLTQFRERIRGQNLPVNNNGLVGHGLWSWSRGNNLIGNVLGMSPTWSAISPPFTGSTPLYQQTYQILYQGTSGCTRTVFCMGSDSQGGLQRNDDSLVVNSTMRWGNFDFVTASTPSGTSGSDGTGIRWCGTGSEANCNIGCTAGTANAPRFTATCSEIPGAFGLMLPANGVPATHTLPPSFYLTSQPAWFVTPWGTPPWPPIGPDVTGGTNPDDTSGHSYAIPSQLAYTNSPIDQTYNDTRTQITSGSWAVSTACGGSGTAYACTTLNGQIYLDSYGVFRMQGSQPPGFDGVFQVFSVNAMQPGYTNLGYCGASANPCIDRQGNTYSTPNNMQYGAFKWGMTRVIAASGLETIMGSTVFGSGFTSGNVNVVGSPSTTCTGTNSNPAGGTENCTMRLNAPLTKSGSGTAQSDSYNVYAGITTGPSAGIYCKQNVAGSFYNGPIPAAVSGTGTDGVIYMQTTPVIMALNSDGVTPNPSCIHPPATNTVYSTQIVYYQPTNPCGGTGTASCTWTSGSMIYPYIRSFNANTSYGTGTLPPTTAPSIINGHGKITGQGKIT